MEKIKLPEFYEKIRFKTVYGTEHEGSLQPINSFTPFFVEKLKPGSKDKPMFFNVKEVIYWENM